MSPAAPSLSGWHPEDVKASIRKSGISLTELSIRNGYGESYLRNALHRPLYDAEQIIARQISKSEGRKVTPQEIWPERYDENGHADARKWWRARRARAEARRAA